jgi:hypothetical protein
VKPEIEAKFDELESLLGKMDVPVERRRSIPWLAKNLAVRNAKHKNFEPAMKIVKELNAMGVR